MMQEEPWDDIYHIQFIVVNINKSSRKNYNKINYSKDLLIKLVMHFNQGQFVQSPQMLPTQAIQNTIKCYNASLSLSLKAEQEDCNWKLVIFGRQSCALDNKNQRLDLSESQNSGKKELRRIGQCEINPSIYIQVFNESEKIKFQENIQISHNISIDYEVFIHRSRQFLDQFLRVDQMKQPIQIVDTAFKKRPGNRKIRYVQLNQNRQTSMNSSDFSIAKKPQISSLVKNGMKYVPHKRQSFNHNLAERKGRQYHLQRKIKPLPSKTNPRTKDMRKIQKDQEKRMKSSVRLKNNLSNPHVEVQRRCSISWQGILLIIILMLVAGYMMFPARKV